jgi:hypothetical protein
MNFLEGVLKDIDAVFLNQNEFAKTLNVDGQDIVAVITDDIITERSQRESGNYEGIYAGKKVLSVRISDFPIRPVRDQIMRVNDEIFIVHNCTELVGIYDITLVENAS